MAKEIPLILGGAEDLTNAALRVDGFPQATAFLRPQRSATQMMDWTFILEVQATHRRRTTRSRSAGSPLRFQYL
jgi:hypothetical protein